MISIPTARVCLRPLSLNDAHALFAYRSLPEVARFQGWCPQSVGDAEDFIRRSAHRAECPEGQWQQFGIYLAELASLIGDCGFCAQANQQAEIGFTIAPPFQRKGLGREAVSALLQYLSARCGIRRVLAHTDPENLASRGLLEGLGFQQELLLKRHVLIRGEWKDDLRYGYSAPQRTHK